MKVVSPLLKRVVYPVMSSAGIFRRTRAPGLAIVTYHGVFPRDYRPADAALDGNLVTQEALRGQLRLLKSKHNLISPDQALSWLNGDFTLPPRAALVTCDDGLLNHLTEMLPVLRDEGIQCLFFVTGSSAGAERATLWYEELFLLFLKAPARHFDISYEDVRIAGDLGEREQRRTLWWDCVKRLSQVGAETRSQWTAAARARFGLQSWNVVEESVSAQRRFSLLKASDLGELVAAGMTIGAHTVSHPILSFCPVEIAKFEIGESRTRLESVLNTRVWAFAYPFGDAQSVSPQVIGMVRDAGYAAAFLNFGGGLGSDLPRFALPRIHVTGNMSLPEFEAQVSGFCALLQRRAGRAPDERLIAQS